ncbi:MAG TPA: 30S ribosomal protein S20, partial [Saprospiraceae bacterium]|nr:30S ribosomal protein S20 [Saprospiraceae bacterium]
HWIKKDTFKLIFCMAHHKSSLKRIRQDAKKRIQNRYYKKSTRTMIKKLRELTDKSEATTMLPKVISMVDRLAKHNNIHKNKAANLKSSLTRHVASI